MNLIKFAESYSPDHKGLSLVLVVGVLGMLGCDNEKTQHPKQVIILGIDGMDYGLTAKMFQEDRLPNLAKIAQQGDFKALGTSIPPQSPVAWSNMMTGTDPGQHGVFDFIHRHPVGGQILSSSATFHKPDPLPIIGDRIDEIIFMGYRWPIRPSGIKINRHATAFWEFLTEAGVPAQVYRMPANYPPTPSSGAHYCCLSDMGTVDLLDTLGIFSYYTSDPDERDMRIPAEKGAVFSITVYNHRADSKFHGPGNEYLVRPASETRVPAVAVPFTIYRDPVAPVATIRFSGQDVVLQQGEWSEWFPIEFEMIPHMVTLRGICRFYMKQVHPHVKLYVSPFNLDPQEKSWEIDQPADFSVTVSDAVGRYYTQGFPEDTEALTNRVLSRDEFLEQAEQVLQERLRLLDFAMDNYQGGLLFFYFGSTDQIGHMFWAAQNPDHPGISPQEHEKYKNVIEDLYVRMDQIAGKVAERFPNATLMVMSDHGFADFLRRFHLNTWLKNNGYAKMRKPLNHKMMANFETSSTRAYGIGFNGLYINLKGRERRGIVHPADKQALMDELATKLKAFRDPDTGDQVVAEVYQCDKVFSGPMLPQGPDMILGFALGYRGSGDSAMGAFPNKLVEDNKKAWGADHMNAPHLVPGVLFTNRKVAVDHPTLLDIAPTVMHQFGLKPTSQMRGRDLFAITTAQAPEIGDGNIGGN